MDVLIAARHHVTVVDSFITSSPRNLAHLKGHPELRVVRRDVAELATGQYDRIYHLASPASPDDYQRAPIATAMTNAVGTQRALEVARRSGARFLLASTSEVYGDPLEHPQRETYWGNVDPIGPRSSYDEGKRFAEALTVAYVGTHGIDARIVRIFNTYGPRMRLRDGRMSSAFITAALRGEPITVEGSGRQTRSLCYVLDTARGLVAAMERGRQGRVYNIGRADEMTVMEFARSVKRVAASEAPIRRVPGRPQDIRRRRPDTRRASRELGWRATTPFGEGLRLTVEWFRTELGIV